MKSICGSIDIMNHSKLKPVELAIYDFSERYCSDFVNLNFSWRRKFYWKSKSSYKYFIWLLFVCLFVFFFALLFSDVKKDSSWTLTEAQWVKLHVSIEILWVCEDLVSENKQDLPSLLMNNRFSARTRRFRSSLGRKKKAKWFYSLLIFRLMAHEN